MRAAGRLVAFLIVCAGPNALGQERFETTLFDQYSSFRLEIERLDDARREVIAQRDKLAGRLDALAGKIKQRKASRTKENLLPDFILQDMLRRSQELSESLTLINRELEALDRARRDRLERLSQLAGRLLEQTAQLIRDADGKRSAELLTVLARLRRERKEIRKEILAEQNPAAPMNTKDLLAADDPEELREQADEVRDEQDRLRRGLASLDLRIAELEAERRLDREMRDFIEDQSLFGEESRVLQVSRTTSRTATSPSAWGGADEKQTDQPAIGEDFGYHDPAADSIDGVAGPGPESSPDLPGTSQSADSGSGSLPDPVEVTVTETQPGRVPVGVEGSEASLEHLSSAKQLQVLKKRRRQIIGQIKQLQILHDRIQEKADSLQIE